MSDNPALGEPHPQRAATVVAAILVRDGRVLLGHRTPHRTSWPNIWDVIGGHVEPGETAAEALVRELREELAISIDPPAEAPAYWHAYDGELMAMWRIDHGRGEITNTAPDEHDALEWFDAAAVAELPMGDEDLRATVLDALRMSSRPVH